MRDRVIELEVGQMLSNCPPFATNVRTQIERDGVVFGFTDQAELNVPRGASGIMDVVDDDESGFFTVVQYGPFRTVDLTQKFGVSNGSKDREYLILESISRRRVAHNAHKDIYGDDLSSS